MPIALPGPLRRDTRDTSSWIAIEAPIRRELLATIGIFPLTRNSDIPLLTPPASIRMATLEHLVLVLWVLYIVLQILLSLWLSL